MGTLRIEPTSESEVVSAGGLERTVWGYVHENEEPRAVYLARWDENALADGVVFLLSFGEWHEGGDPGTRRSVGVLSRKHQGRLAFMIVDAADADFRQEDELGIALRRDQVMGTAYEAGTFAVLERIVVDDERISALRDRIEHGP